MSNLITHALRLGRGYTRLTCRYLSWWSNWGPQGGCPILALDGRRHTWGFNTSRAGDAYMYASMDWIIISSGNGLGPNTFGAGQATNHSLNQSWLFIWTPSNNFQCYLNQHMKIWFKENAVENAICKMASIFSGAIVLKGTEAQHWWQSVPTQQGAFGRLWPDAGPTEPN